MEKTTEAQGAPAPPELTTADQEAAAKRILAKAHAALESALAELPSVPGNVVVGGVRSTLQVCDDHVRAAIAN